MATYEDILEEIGRCCCNSQPTSSQSTSPSTATANSKILHEILKRHESAGVAVLASAAAVAPIEIEAEDSSPPAAVLPFRPGGLTDRIVARLLVSNATELVENSQKTKDATTIARNLVVNLRQTYLPAIARSLSDLVAVAASNNGSNGQTKLYTTQELLGLWVSLVANATTGVHELLADALVSFASLNGNGDKTSQLAMAYLVEHWKSHILAKRSCEAVRYAVVLVKWMSRLSDGFTMAEEAGATALFVQMLGDFDDPLQQLSLLDALVQEFGSDGQRNPAPTTNVAEWLSSPAMLSTVIKCLKDPLLSDAALRFIGILSMGIRPQEVETILEHIRWVVDQAGRIPSRDTERLPLVAALSGAAVSSREALEKIMADAILRQTWWDVDRIAVPKLKAAILVSVATALSVVGSSFGTAVALRAYWLLGQDNRASDAGTTQWLLGMARAPIPEVAIAAVACLEVALRLPGDGTYAVFLGADSVARTSLLELLLPAWTAPLQPLAETPHGRVARFHLLEAFMKIEPDAPTVAKLRERYALGAHGRIPLRHGTDEPATAA